MWRITNILSSATETSKKGFDHFDFVIFTEFYELYREFFPKRNKFDFKICEIGDAFNFIFRSEFDLSNFF